MKKNKIKEEKIIRKEWRNIVFDCSFAILAILFTLLFYNKPYLTTISLAIVSIIGLLRWKSKLAFSIFIFGGLFGPVAEMIAIKYGVWTYARPDFFNIPFWLFILWGMAAVFLFEIAKEIHKLGVEDN